MQKQDTGIAQIHWKVSATLFIAESRSAPWKAAAVLTGDHIIAATDCSYDRPEDVAMYYDDMGDERLLRTWNILANLYIPIAGYLSYHEWVNDLWQGGGVVAVLAPWVAPVYRGSDVSHWLLEAYSLAFDDGIGYCTDNSWRDWINPRDDETEMELNDDADTMVHGPGVMFISLPGSRMLGYSVWDANRDEPTARLLRHNGERVGVRTRWGRGEPIKGGLWPRLMEVAKKIEADIVLYDPDDGDDEADSD
jgi:hypothetical protein